MHAAMICRKHPKLIFFSIIILTAVNCHSQNNPLYRAFAHNDYWHKRPLYDALDNGYSHIEADIYLQKGKLVVSHTPPLFKRKRTLEELYIKPLLECVKGTNTKAICPPYPLMLMIDIKSNANRTYAELDKLLRQYSEILSSYENGQLIRREVTVVLSGHKPARMLKMQAIRYAFIDEDLMNADQDTSATDLYQTASCKYSRLLKWDGHGDMPPNERQRLSAYVQTAHKYGKKVRLWASPENKAVWRELLACGVDLINTNQLLALRNFLISEKPNYAQAD